MDFKKPPSEEVIILRVSEFHKNRLKGLAKMYAGGNLTLYLLYNGLNATRKHITKADLHRPNRRKK